MPTFKVASHYSEIFGETLVETLERRVRRVVAVKLLTTVSGRTLFAKILSLRENTLVFCYYLLLLRPGSLFRDQSWRGGREELLHPARSRGATGGRSGAHVVEGSRDGSYGISARAGDGCSNAPSRGAAQPIELGSEQRHSGCERDWCWV